MTTALTSARHASRRVALVTDTLSDEVRESMLLRLARGLRSAGWTPELVTTVSAGDGARRLRDDGIAHVELTRPGLSFESGLTHAERVGRYFRTSGHRALFLHRAPYAQATLGMLPQDVVAVPVLDDEADESMRAGLSNPQGWNAAIAVSERVRREALRRLPWHEIRTVALGVEVPATLPERVPLPGFRVVFAGRLDHGQEGVLHLPEIVRRVLEDGIDVRVEVLGDGPDRHALQRRLATDGVSDRVLLRGAVDAETAQATFARSDALLMPTFHDGPLVTLLEAMAQGCVPVVSQRPGHTDAIVESGTSGLFAAPGDPAGFAARLLRLARDPEMRQSMSTAARERVLQHFSGDAMIAGYLRVLEEGLSGKLPTPTPRHRVPRVNALALEPVDFVPGAVRMLGRRLLAR